MIGAGAAEEELATERADLARARGAVGGQRSVCAELLPAEAADHEDPLCV